MSKMNEEFQREIQRMSDNLARLNERLERKEAVREKCWEIFGVILMLLTTLGMAALFLLVWFDLITSIINS